MKLNDLVMQSANMHQTTNATQGKSDWSLRENKTDRVLYTLPKTISDKDMFCMIKVIREVEKDSYQLGVSSSARSQVDPLKQEIDFLRKELNKCILHSNNLANKLQAQLPEES